MEGRGEEREGGKGKEPPPPFKMSASGHETTILMTEASWFSRSRLCCRLWRFRTFRFRRGSDYLADCTPLTSMLLSSECVTCLCTAIIRITAHVDDVDAQMSTV